MDNSLQRHFFEEFTKYPRDGALHELLENTLVVQVLNNRAERRMKVSLLFETYPDKSVRQYFYIPYFSRPTGRSKHPES